MRRFGLFLGAFLLAAPLSAQTGAIVEYELQIFNPGVPVLTGTPFIKNTIPAVNVLCNQAMPTLPTTAVVNPRKVYWIDPVTARACVVDQAAVLLALPAIPGSYVATITVTDDTGQTSERSMASNPFGRSVPPAARTGLRVLP